MSTAVVFPGQGSQSPGIGMVWRDRPEWELVDQAERVTGVDLAHLLLDADAEELASTDAAQLQVLAASLLAWRALAPTLGPDVVGMAGHSLGQITALVASGALGLADGFRLAAARAAATRDADRARPGGLLALLGADERQATDACTAAPGRAWVANLNGPNQVVVGGDVTALAAVAERATALGVRRVIPLAVGGAFHTPWMAGAATSLAPTLADLRFRSPTWPLVTNHDARVVTDGRGWPERLVRHLTEPVRWDASVRRLAERGADRFVEVGPGSTLSALVRRIVPEAEVRSVGCPDDLATRAA